MPATSVHRRSGRVARFNESVLRAPSLLSFDLWNLAEPRKKDNGKICEHCPSLQGKTSSVCLGARGSHLIAKNANTGSCPAMSSCQR